MACSFWIGCALQREYTMGQPLKCSFHNDLQKCPVEKRCVNSAVTLQKSFKLIIINLIV
jgi:hypothetical protein